MSRTHESMTWAVFTRTLTDALRDLTIGELIRIDVWTTTERGERELLTHAYAIRHARHRARIAVAAGPEFPGGRGSRLTPHQEARLASTGWHQPSDWGGPDYYRDGDFAQVEALGARLVQALRQVWGVSDPSGIELIGRHGVDEAAPEVDQLGA